MVINNKKRTLMQIVFLLAIIFSLPIFSMISAKIYKITSYPSTAPIIDGIIGETEWQGSKESKIPLYDPWNQGPGNTIEISILSMYCNNSFLYLGITTPLGLLATSITIMIYFHSNINSDFRSDSTILPGNDLKIVSVNENNSYDCITVERGYDPQEYENDLDHGGTKDFEVKYSLSNLESTFEFKMPMNSGDTKGGDINLDITNEAEIYIKINSLKNENCLLVISENSVLPISPISLILGIITITSIQIIIKRKYSEKNYQYEK